MLAWCAGGGGSDVWVRGSRDEGGPGLESETPSTTSMI